VSLRKAEWYVCPCGREVYRRRRKGHQVVLCYECAAALSESSALQMRDKAGPAWDAWCASNAAGTPGRTTQTQE
jgi:hypothetical protein